MDSYGQITIVYFGFGLEHGIFFSFQSTNDPPKQSKRIQTGHEVQRLQNRYFQMEPKNLYDQRSKVKENPLKFSS